MVKQPSTSPFQAMEEEAYQAFLEWPVWLVLREKELASYLVDRKRTREQLRLLVRAINQLKRKEVFHKCAGDH